MTFDPPHYDHATIADAGACPECRRHNIDQLVSAPVGYMLTFIDADTDAASVAVLRTWTGDPVEDAWATGCNPGGHVAISGPIDPDILVAAGVPLFTVIGQPGATAAVDALRAAIRDHEL